MSKTSLRQICKGLVLTLLGSFSIAGMGLAQGLYAPVITVNDDAITTYELEQRQRFLQLLNSPGDPATEARKGLIEDRLKLQASRRFGIVATEEGIKDGMEEFASRANLSADEFIKALSQNGVGRETFRDFVATGITWRELVRARFGGQVNISQAEIDRALAATNGGGSVRVLISEIIMPAPPQQLATVQARAQQISQITTEAAFSAAARKYSATASRGRGGRLDWVPLNNLPPALRPQILGLSPGQVTQPISIPDAIALFQLRAIEELADAAQEYAAIEYATYFIPGGRTDSALAEAAKVVSRIDVCDDLYGVAKGQPEDVLERVTQAPADIPDDIAIELAKLDEGETSTVLTRNSGQTLMVLMMCGRTAAANAEADPEAVANSLRQRQLNAYSDSYLEQLRADALIIEK